MAQTRLTPFAKILIVALVVGGVYFGLTKLKDPSVKDKIKGLNTERGAESKDGYKDVINIGVVTWGGYAGGQYFNKGFEANTAHSFIKITVSK